MIEHLRTTSLSEAIAPEPTAVSRREVSVTERLALVDQAIDSIGIISRTFSGISDTSISVAKQPLLLSGNELRERVLLNFRNAAQWLVDPLNDFPASPEVVAHQLEQVVQRANSGLIRPEAPRFRTWPGFSTQIPPDEIPAALKSFCVEYAARYTQDRDEIIPFAAWIEREYNSRIHPLPDGCGRVSKIFSTAALARGGLGYPRFGSREEYFAEIVEPLPVWVGYFRSQMLKPECRQ